MESEAITLGISTCSTGVMIMLLGLVSKNKNTKDVGTTVMLIGSLLALLTVIVVEVRP